MSTFAKNELMQLKTGSEVRERMIQEDQHKFEEERRKLLEQSVEAQKRIEQLEQEKLERDRHLEDIKARLDAKEQQVADIQVSIDCPLRLFLRRFHLAVSSLRFHQIISIFFLESGAGWCGYIGSYFKHEYYYFL